MTDTAVSSANISSQLTALRAELKQWEKGFVEANGGRKAGRKDIKQHPTIGDSSVLQTVKIQYREQVADGYSAAKYKTYGRLRALESKTAQGKDGRKEKSPPESHAKRKPSPEETDALTPRKLPRREFSTPSNNHIPNGHPSQLDPYDSPSVLRRLFSPMKDQQSHSSPVPFKSAIGPTPQRDGRALGIFDLLSNSGGSTATPSAKRMSTMPAGNMQTPSKKVNMATIPEEEEEISRGGRTPASSNKRLYLERLFATPTTLRYATMVENEDEIRMNTIDHMHIEMDAPPSLESGTPPFLRRSNSGRITSNAPHGGTGLSPITVRKPSLFVKKGLSALIKGLRDLEDERIQDDMEALWEAEAEQAGTATAAAEDDVQVRDSQALANGSGMLGRQWKKRGQKRTTRRVQMKPLPPKPKPGAPTTSTNDTKNEVESASATESPALPVLPDAQGKENGEERDNSNAGDDDAFPVHSASDPDPPPDPNPELDPDYKGGEEESGATTRQSSRFSEKIKAAFSVVKNVKSGGGKTPKTSVKAAKADKAVSRKINPQAHANYRSLKLRNKTSKASIAARRFGRRR
jgi:DNA replication and checkpoint protein